MLKTRLDRHKPWVLHVEQSLHIIRWEFLFFRRKKRVQFRGKGQVLSREIIRRLHPLYRKRKEIILSLVCLFFKFVHTHVRAPRGLHVSSSLLSRVAYRQRDVSGQSLPPTPLY